MPRGDGQRKVLQRVGHTVDVKNEPGQDDGGRKPVISPVWAARSCCLVRMEMSSPCPSAGMRKVLDKTNRANTDPRRGTSNRNTPASAQMVMENMPRK